MTQRRTTRRSFLARVAGGSLIFGGPLSLIAGRASAMQVTDHDPTDPSGHGRGGGTGVTDSDSGPGADPAGRGRGVSGGESRGEGFATGVTDSDTGPSADPPQRGRGTQLHAQNARDCRDARNRLANIEAQLSQSAPRLREMEATYNWIAGSAAQEDKDQRIGQSAYLDRVRRFGIDVPYGSSPQWIMQQLREEIERARSEVQPLEQEAAELRQAMTNINCAY
jgi:hypothetical protein